MKAEFNIVDKFLSVRQIANLLNCKQSSVYAWAKSGKLPAYKINGLLRFDLREIQDWLNKCKIQPIFEKKNNPYKNTNDVDIIIKNAIDSVKKSGYINPAGDTRLTYKGKKGGIE